MGNPVILVVDNEAEIRQLLNLHLRNCGMTVLEAASGAEAVSILEAEPVDLVVLDLMMQEMSGWDVLKFMLSEEINPLVIVLSARQLESDKIEALGLGADDYMTKPFSPAELVARIQANLRRNSLQPKGERVKYGDFIYDMEIHELKTPNGTVTLSPIEGSILELMLQSPNRVFTKEEIFKHVWKLETFDPNPVNVYINFLRKKIEDNPSSPRYIQTIRGVGYRFADQSYEA